MTVCKIIKKGFWKIINICAKGNFQFLLFAFLFVSFILIGSFFYLFYHQQKQTIQNTLYYDLKESNNSAAKALSKSTYYTIFQQKKPSEEDIKQFKKFLIKLKDDNKFFNEELSAFKYSDSKITSLATTDNRSEQYMNADMFSFLIRTAKSEQKDFVKINNKDQWIRSLHPIYSKDKNPVGILEIRLPHSFLNNKLAAHRNAILCYSLISFFIITILSFLTNRKFVHPLSEITRKLEDMSDKPIEEWELLKIEGDAKVVKVANFINDLISKYCQILTGLQDSAAKLQALQNQLISESNQMRLDINEISKQSAPILGLPESPGNLLKDVSSVQQLVSVRSESIKTALNEIFYSLKRIEEDITLWMDLVKKSYTSISKLDTGLDRMLEEIGEINPCINGVNKSVRAMVKSFQHFDINSQELSLSAEKTAGFIKQMEKSIDNINTISHNLSKAADDTSNLMAKMAYSIQLIESNAKKSRELSEIVASDVEKGMNAIRKTIEGMDRINKAVEETSRVIKRLGDRSQEIGVIINVIEDIAEQTNLLALNASIIAAQAGEQGKGFAVVADEIRDLAARTSSSTQDISKLILTVQEEVRDAVQSMKEGSEKVEEGVKLSNQAGKIFEKILEGTRNSTEMVKKIAEATVEQTNSSAQAFDGIKEFTALIQKISKATAGHIANLPDINKIVGGLSSRANRISQTVASLQDENEQILEAMNVMKEKSLKIGRGVKDQQKRDHILLNLINQIKDKDEFITKIINQLSKDVEDIRLYLEPMMQKLELLMRFKAQQETFRDRLNNYIDDINNIAQRQRDLASKHCEGYLQLEDKIEDISKK
jgi:methyl-accepting chemotaxis protein